MSKLLENLKRENSFKNHEYLEQIYYYYYRRKSGFNISEEVIIMLMTVKGTMKKKAEIPYLTRMTVT